MQLSERGYLNTHKMGRSAAILVYPCMVRHIPAISNLNCSMLYRGTQQQLFKYVFTNYS